MRLSYMHSRSLIDWIATRVKGAPGDEGITGTEGQKPQLGPPRGKKSFRLEIPRGERSLL